MNEWMNEWMKEWMKNATLNTQNKTKNDKHAILHKVVMNFFFYPNLFLGNPKWKIDQVYTAEFLSLPVTQIVQN